MPRRADPDYVLDADRGSAGLGAKVAEVLTPEAAGDRAESRAGLRELDAMTEGMGGLTRQQRDRERVSPRATTAPLAHPVMQRPLPGPQETRAPFSSRQKKARSKTRIAVQDEMPNAQYEAQTRLVTDPARWRATNDALSAAAGDVQELPEAEQARLRRIDRSIQAYERSNDRGHVVYANVQMPPQINRSNLAAFLGRNFAAGDAVAFDRYTFGTHQLHETSRDADGDTAGRVAVFEIQTRRGAYLGHSDSQDDTAHLLPRGMTFSVAGVHQATYAAPDGTTGTRMVVQLRDTTPEPADTTPAPTTTTRTSR